MDCGRLEKEKLCTSIINKIGKNYINRSLIENKCESALELRLFIELHCGYIKFSRALILNISKNSTNENERLKPHHQDLDVQLNRGVITSTYDHINTHFIGRISTHIWN